MRSLSFRVLRFGGLLVLILVLLAGCAGEESPSEPSSNDQVSAADSPESAANTARTDSTPAANGTPQEALAAIVNGQPITLAEFERERQRYLLFQPVEPATSDMFDAEVLQHLIEQVLIEQFAVSQGIVVTDEEVEAELAAQAELAAASGTTLDEYIASQLYTMDEYREAQRDVLLANKVRDVVIANVPTTTAQVHARHILVADEATARALLDQLHQGADFAQLAAQYSLDPTTSRTGGDLAWVSEGDLLQPEVEAVVFSLQPGTRTETPVRSSLGYHIIEVLERVEGRPLDQAALSQRQQTVFQQWLRTQYDSAEIERFVGAEPIN